MTVSATASDAGATPGRTVLVGSSALTTAVLPYFLVGALAVSVQRDLGITETAIGALGTILFLTGAAAATPAGRFVDRIGAGPVLRTGVTLAGLSALGIAILVDRWWQLAVLMAVVGSSVAMIDTGAARAFADRIRADRQGAAFGIKEASIPAATMAAGLAIPTVAAHFGWRATFIGAFAIAVVVFLLIPPRGALAGGYVTAVSTARARVATAGAVRFAAGVGLGTAAATAAATFLVPAFVDRGMAEAPAGFVLALASVGAVVMRVSVGVLADRPTTRPVVLVSGLLVTGAAGAVALALGAPNSVAVAAAFLLITGGWGWTGLAFLAVVRANPDTPGAAAGVVLAGLGTGGALGPLSFGVLAERWGFATAWGATTGGLLVASVVVLSARHALTVPAAGPTAR